MKYLYKSVFLQQAPLQSHRLPHRGYRPDLQLPRGHLNILHHLHYHHCLLHDEHIRRFRHRDVSGAGRTRVQKLWAGQESGIHVHIVIGDVWYILWVLYMFIHFVCLYSVNVWNMPWRPAPCAGTSLKTLISTKFGTWWTPPTSNTWCSPLSCSTPSAWPCRSVCSTTRFITLQWTQLFKTYLLVCVYSITVNLSPSTKPWIFLICCSPASSLWKWSSNSSPSNPGYGLHTAFF